MANSVIGYDNVGEAGFPSPAVWGTCQKSLLNELGLGFYVDQQFFGDTPTLPGLPTDSDSGSTFTYNSGTQDNRAIDVAVTNTDNNAAAIFTRPLGPLTKNSGKKLWFEAEVALAEIADQGVFVGLAELDALDRDVIADNAGAPASESLIGFFCGASDQDAFDAVYRKDAGSLVTVLADVTKATAIPEAERASLSANGFVRLGLAFDGRDKLRYFVNGHRVAEVTVDGTFDQVKEYGGIVALKTGAAAARTLRVRFFRAAAQVRT